MKRKNRELKAIARQALCGHYALLAGAVMIIIALELLFTNMSGLFTSSELTIKSFVMQTLVTFITSALNFLFQIGFCAMILHLIRGEQYGMGDILYTFKNGPDRFIILAAIQILITIVLEIPALYILYSTNLKQNSDTILYYTLLLIGSLIAIIVTLGFTAAMYLLIDNEDMEAMESIRQSFDLMRGNKLRIFILDLSFWGLLFLGLLSMGIGLLWIIPYMKATEIVFYLEISGQLDRPHPETASYSQPQNNYYYSQPRDESSYYSRPQDGPSSYYSRPQDGPSSYYSRSQEGPSADYSKSPEGPSAYSYRSPQESSANYSGTPEESATNYSGSPEENSSYERPEVKMQSSYEPAQKDTPSHSPSYKAPSQELPGAADQDEDNPFQN